jgi:hypothetical protein
MLCVALLATGVASLCTSAGDCQHNGACDRTIGACRCHAGWAGAACGLLDLAPAAPHNGLRQLAPNGSFTSTWGGSIQKLDGAGVGGGGGIASSNSSSSNSSSSSSTTTNSNGGSNSNSSSSSNNNNASYYLLAAEIIGGCGVKEYRRNSRGTLAVSTAGAAGPYARLRTAVPVFAHNLQTARLPRGAGVVAFLLGHGQREPGLLPPKDCRAPPAPTPAPTPAPPAPPAPPRCGERGWAGGACNATITVLHAPSIAAALAPANVTLRLLAGAGIGNFNPAPLVFANGSVALLFNAKNFSRGGGCCTCASWQPCLAFATAPSWRGPFTMLAPRIWPDRLSGAACEDPFLWGDAAGVLHLLCHHAQPDPFHNTSDAAGVHAFSADGGRTWSKPVPAYGYHAELTNGSALDFVRRERPWLVFDDGGSGAPTHLLNGVSLNTGTGFTWTFVQPIAPGGRLGRA